MNNILATVESVDPEGVGALIGTALIWTFLALLGLWIHNRSYRPRKLPIERNRKHHSITPFTFRRK